MFDLKLSGWTERLKIAIEEFLKEADKKKLCN
jgi:hypothetical protein